MTLARCFLTYASKLLETSTRRHLLSINLEYPPYHFHPELMNCLSSPVRSSGTNWPNSPMPVAYSFTMLEGPPSRIGYTLSALATVSPTACVKRSPPFGPCPWMVMVVPETDTTYTYSFVGSKVLPVSMVPTNSHCPAAMLVLAATSMVVASFRLAVADAAMVVATEVAFTTPAAWNTLDQPFTTRRNGPILPNSKLRWIPASWYSPIESTLPLSRMSWNG